MMHRHTPLLCLTAMMTYATSFSFIVRHSRTRRVLQLHTTVPKGTHRHAPFSAATDSDAPDSTFANVTLETSSNTKVLQVRQGEILRTAMLKRNASPHNGRSRLINCRGLGTCGTCAVEIECNNINVSGIQPRERNTKENLRLKFPPHGSANQSPNLRLACQVQVHDDIIVKKRNGFWGQDTDGLLAGEYEAELWFGELEYVLDNKSPNSSTK